MGLRNPAARQGGVRKRLTAEEARARILAAAERKLAEVGPEGLRLTELATELEISHPAILHHFGSREELVAEVVTRATIRLNERLAEMIASREAGREAILDMIAEFYGAEGHARLIAWLVLSGRGLKARARHSGGRPLERLIEVAHAQRVHAHPERAIEFADSKFRSQLAALALLGEAIFGDLIRFASGDASTAGGESSRDFRRRLARLLADAD
jgi:AcrR family transcriptional regulator